MDHDSRLDIFSDLPHSIIETILTKLPLRDAVRTSVLSSRWRYEWTTITQLVFDDKCVPPSDDRASFENCLMNFIFRVLFLHDGPIHKFTLISQFLQSCPDIDQWLLFLSRRDIKELVLQLADDEWFRAPSCLYSCHKLTRLELVRCELEPPLKFKGFLNLKNLTLQQVVISQNDIEHLISSCPLLESLTLSYFDGLELTIRAPNLKFLILEGEFKEICLENTPLLMAISVAMYMTDDIAEHFEQSLSCNFDKFLGGVQRLQRLSGHIYFTKYLSIGSGRGSTPIVFHNLKCIDLYQISFEDIKEVLVLLRLVVNSPNLEELQVSGTSITSPATESYDPDFYENQFPADCKFKHLRTVKITDVTGMPLEMAFIKLLLGHSPALEVITITPSVYVADGKLNMLVSLLRFRRASSLAELIFIQEPL
ncbi:hypothetical protein LIER_29165 [Lithospermum erythrorhizon]|uniref:FBD domain-containing protein n=1 Tax=Lithospermum erythrorhizon TaxID=34254 RepID=A0AAV3RIN5_LITER